MEQINKTWEKELLESFKQRDPEALNEIENSEQWEVI